jgi:hypothetical protein
MLPKRIRAYGADFLQKLWVRSIKSAIKEQGLNSLMTTLCNIVPDITHQYSNFEVRTHLLNTKVRALHAFQLSLVDKVIKEIDKPIIVDIGDSAGTHLQYLLGLYSDNKKIECLSVNLDDKAVERIRKKGLSAVHTRAEDLQNYDIKADIFLCFEILEHLMNPCCLLQELSSNTNAEFLIVTVPYLKSSRVGLHHIRGARKDVVNAENTHIFELSPEDWKLVFKHSGWTILEESVYLQYPKRHFWFVTKPLWKKFDFEGFYGVILKRDNTWSSKYLDW